MRILTDIESLVSAQLEVMKTAYSLLKVETRLAGLSIFPLLINLLLLLVSLIGTWTVGMVAMGYLIYLFLPNILLCMVVVLVLNFVILLGLLQYLSFNLKNMSFEKTRQFLNQTERDYVQQKKTSSFRKNGTRTTAALSTNRRSDA